MTDFIEVVTTFELTDQARLMSNLILEKKLGACCSIQPIESIYNWKGVVETSNEFQLTIKTAKAHGESLKTLILENHPYETPQVIVMPIIGGSEEYLRWIKEETN